MKNKGIVVTRYLKKCLALFLFFVMLFTVGCTNKALPKAKQLVLTVDHSKVYLDEMMYHILLADLQGQLVASLYNSEDAYWKALNEEGVTMAEVAKEMVMDNAIKYEILYQVALEEGYTLTEEEKEISHKQVDSILKNVKKEQIEASEFSEQKLLEIQNKIALSTRYYQDYIKKLGVDEAAIVSDFSSEAYKQYDIQYIFASTMKVDSNGSIVNMKDEEKTQVLEEIDSLLEAAQTAEDITLLATNKQLSSGYLTYTQQEDPFGEEANLKENISSMAVGEVKGIIETVKGYYILRLVDNTSTKKYDVAVKEALENSELEAFKPAFELLKKEHTIKINHRVWDTVQIKSDAQ